MKSARPVILTTLAAVLDLQPPYGVSSVRPGIVRWPDPRLLFEGSRAVLMCPDNRAVVPQN